MTYNKLFQSEIWLVLLLGFCGFLYQLITLDLPKGGDSLVYWITSFWINNDLSYIANQHSSRLGVVLPVVIVQFLFGTHPTATHVAPLLFYLVTIAATYTIARQITNKLGAVVAALLVMTIPQMDYADQIMPGIFEAGWLSLSLLFLLLSTRKQDFFFLFLSAICLFFAYASRFTAIFLVFPYLYIMISREFTIKHIFVFMLTLLIGYVSEHMYFFQHGFPLGRLEMLIEWGKIQPLSNSYFEDQIITNVFHFFRRYTPNHVGYYWTIFFVYLTGIIIFWTKIRNRISQYQNLDIIIIIVVGLFVFGTFFIRSIDPIIVLPPRARFFTIYAAPVAVLFSSVAIGLYYSSVKTRSTINKKFYFLLLLPFIIVTFSSNIEAISKGINKIADGKHALQIESHGYDLANQAFNSGELILYKASDGYKIKDIRFYYLHTDNWGDMKVYRKNGYWIKEKKLIEHDLNIGANVYHVLVDRNVFNDRSSLNNWLADCDNKTVVLVNRKFEMSVEKACEL